MSTDIDGIVVVQSGETDEQRGFALKDAYDAAKQKAFNKKRRMTVVVPPGRYDVGSFGLLVNSDCVDIVGLIEANVMSAGRRNMAIRPTVTIYGSGMDVVHIGKDHVTISDVELVATSKSGAWLYDVEHPRRIPAALAVDAEVGNNILFRRCLIRAEDQRRAIPTRVGDHLYASFVECVIIGSYSLGGYPPSANYREHAFYGHVERSYIEGPCAVAGGGGTCYGSLFDSCIEGCDSVAAYGEINGVVERCMIRGIRAFGTGGGFGFLSRITDTCVEGPDAM